MTTKKLTLTLSVAAAAVAIAAGSAVAFAAIPSSAPTVNVAAGAADDHATGDALIAKECVRNTQGIPNPASWRAGARYDLSAQLGFLVIRNDKQAAVCVIENGKAGSVMGGDVSTRHTYTNLTSARPFDYLSSWNTDNESVHFGIATDNVAKVALVGPDGSQTPTVLKDGTFIAKTKFAEDSNQSTSNHVRATLDNGQVVTGPFRG
ncbi:hypothetical protein [Kutzneria sp. CA-103260]|uniref:hypothetical protein n=1 Tax=Kutzneria sp. CA-103260 TaxID=2802641 RepID=UPI001BA76F45|nr:hypothetical protein [Kutzneria sp. CA-103260]QUQ68658.1 hypothetical protein JJ691_64050 [Kutzneria sp. CA-103260]